LDVGGIFGHRLSPIHYTSITEIKGFRFKSQAGPAPKIPRALLGGDNHSEVMA